MNKTFKVEPRNFLLLVLLSIASVAYGQKSSKVATEQICDCVGNKIANAEQIHYRDSVARCFGDALAIHMSDLKDEFEIKEKNTTVESVMEVRDRLLIILEKKCKYFKKDD